MAIYVATKKSSWSFELQQKIKHLAGALSTTELKMWTNSEKNPLAISGGTLSWNGKSFILMFLLSNARNNLQFKPSLSFLDKISTLGWKLRPIHNIVLVIVDSTVACALHHLRHPTAPTFRLRYGSVFKGCFRESPEGRAGRPPDYIITSPDQNFIFVPQDFAYLSPQASPYP